MIDLKGKKAFIAGVGDDVGFGWAIAKTLYEAGAQVYVGTWPPVYSIFTQALSMGKYDESKKCRDGAALKFAGIYPFDGSYDSPEDVPESVRENKRYKNVSGYTISEVAEKLHHEVGTIDIVVHALANAPEVKKPLLETSRAGYLAAMSASSYSFISMMQHFAPIMNKGGSALTLTYAASTQIIPGYGGGMSSAKAALESDVRSLAYELGQKYRIRCNAISAGAYSSRAARAIGFIEEMIAYSEKNAPLSQAISAEDVAQSALFLLSEGARSITGEVLFVDAGLHNMGVASSSGS